MASLQTVKLFQGDIVVSGGKTVLLYDNDALAQILQNKLTMWAGEWFLDKTQGIDYLGILGQQFFLDRRFNLAIRKILLADPRVTSVLTISCKLDKDDNVVADYDIQSIYGPISGSINSAGIGV